MSTRALCSTGRVSASRAFAIDWGKPVSSPLNILARTFRPVDLPRRVQAGCSRCGSALVGVYLLIAREEVTYVGTSTDIIHRLYGQLLDRRRRRKRFDRALWLPLPASVLSHYRGALIRALRPKHNGKAPRSHGYDAEILWGLGLKDELSDEEIAA